MDVKFLTSITKPANPLPHLWTTFWALTRNSSRSWPPVHWWRKLEGLRSHSNSVNLVMGCAIQCLWSGTTLVLPHLWESNRGSLTQLWAACEALGTRSPTFNERALLGNWKVSTFLCWTLLTQQHALIKPSSGTFSFFIIPCKHLPTGLHTCGFKAYNKRSAFLM